MANQMSRQSVINMVYAALRGPKNDPLRPSLQVMALLYALDIRVNEAGYAAEKYGDLPVGSVDSR